MALSNPWAEKQAKKLGYYGGGSAGSYTPPPGNPAQTIQHEGVGGGWQEPGGGYANLIAGDPTWIQNQAEIRANRGTVGRSLSDAIKQAIVRFGAAPTNWQDKYATGAIDAATVQAAKENKLSTINQIQEQRGRSREDLASALAGRGLVGGTGLESGATSAGEQRIQTDFERAEGTAGQNLLDALSGFEGSYSQNILDLEREQRQAREAAAGRVMGTFDPVWKYDTDPWTETLPATQPPAWQNAVFGDVGAATAMSAEDYAAALREWIKAGAGDPTDYGWR